jgi:hypothetical protein
MSALDVTARGMVARNRSDDRRLATLAALARGIGEHGAQWMAPVIDVPLAESREAATQIASGTSYGFDNGSAASDHRQRFSLYGGAWGYNQPWEVRTHNFHGGDGADPSANLGSNPGGVIRFMTHAPRFEVLIRNAFGFRVKVNGKYAKQGLYGVSELNGDAFADPRFFLFDFDGTEFAGTGLKLIEIQGDMQLDFSIARVPLGHTVSPWPQAVPLRAALHGDSMITTVSESATDHRTSLYGLMPQIVQNMTGIADVWANNIGGVGFVSDGGPDGTGGNKSTFVEQAAADFAGGTFDLVWELGGRNDAASYGSEASYRAAIRHWLDIVLADNPDTIVIMTGPLSVSTSESYPTSAAFAAMQRAKRDACAMFPRNCAFIPTVGSAAIADPWIFGTGREGSAVNDGNADLVIGLDGTHPTTFGHCYLAGRLIGETGRVLPLLASRIRDGVIAGVNDRDLTA